MTKEEREDAENAVLEEAHAAIERVLAAADITDRGKVRVLDHLEGYIQGMRATVRGRLVAGKKVSR